MQRQRCAVATLPSSPLRESASPACQQQRTAAQNQLGLRRPDAQQLLGPLVAAQASGFHLATAAQTQQGTDQSARAVSEILMAIAQKTAAQSLTLLAKEAAALVVALLAPRAPSQSQNFGPGPACATLRARLQHPPGAPASSSLTGQGLVDKGTTLQQLTLSSPFLTGQQGSLPAPRVLMSPNPTLQSPSGCHRVEANEHWTQKVAQNSASEAAATAGAAVTSRRPPGSLECWTGEPLELELGSMAPAAAQASTSASPSLAGYAWDFPKAAVPVARPSRPRSISCTCPRLHWHLPRKFRIQSPVQDTSCSLQFAHSQSKNAFCQCNWSQQPATL